MLELLIPNTYDDGFGPSILVEESLFQISELLILYLINSDI